MAQTEIEYARGVMKISKFFFFFQSKLFQDARILDVSRSEQEPGKDLRIKLKQIIISKAKI